RGLPQPRVAARASEEGPRLGLGFNGADRGLAHLEAQPGFGAAPRVTIQRGEVCFGRPRSDRLADRHVVPGVPAPVDPHPGVEIELSEVAMAGRRRMFWPHTSLAGKATGSPPSTAGWLPKIGLARMARSISRGPDGGRWRGSYPTARKKASVTMFRTGNPKTRVAPGLVTRANSARARSSSVRCSSTLRQKSASNVWFSKGML